MPDLPPPVLAVVWAVFGLFVGSFLNVAIHRYGIEGESVARPRRSRCPSCRTTLTWKENIPLVSWLVQGGRCRTCRWRIPARYPLVEALTGGLWFLVAASTPVAEVGLLLVRTAALSALVVATFVDFDCFEIPDGVSIGGMLAAPVVSLLVPALHADTALALAIEDPVGPFAALTACLAGMAAGGGVLWVTGWVGGRLLGKEAMGLGDVKLLAAGGGFVGPGGVFYALVIASIVGSIIGLANILRFLCETRRRARRRGRQPRLSRSYRVAHHVGSHLPFGPYLALGIGIVLLYWNHVPRALW